MENQFKMHLKSVEGQTQDLNFFNGQTSDKIRSLEAENTNLRQQLEQALSGQTTNTRLLDGSQKKVSFAPKAPGFEMSHTLAGDDNETNGGCTCSKSCAYQGSQEVWAEELRRADDRCNKFRQDISELQSLNAQLENDIFLLNEKVSVRDQEISRLQVVSAGASSYTNIRENFDTR